MLKRGRYKKKKKDKQNRVPYIVIAAFIILISFVLVSESNHSEVYSFCEELEKLDSSGNNDIELRNELKKLCGKELSQHDQELGTLSIEFLKNLSSFNRTWKENESIAKEHATQVDSVYSKIKGMNDNSSKISTQVDSLYKAQADYLDRTLEAQLVKRENINSSLDQLEEKNNSLTAALKQIRAEEKAKKDQETSRSLIYSQRKNESIDVESNLSFSKDKYEKIKGNFNDNLLPFILIGIALGAIISVVLSLKWKKERSYWDAYSSSAKVISPLKLVALLTGILLVILLLYLLLSGKLEAIFVLAA